MASVAPIVLGLFCIVLGILNMKGNITSVHRYHRHRILPQDVVPFGKKIGLGTLLIGVSITIYEILFLISEKTGYTVFVSIGCIVLVAGMAAGVILSLYAIIKYNKGLF